MFYDLENKKVKNSDYNWVPSNVTIIDYVTRELAKMFFF